MTPSSPAPTSLIEDYLANIFVAERDREVVMPIRLARSMGVAPPTVTATLRRMVRDGFLTDDDGGIHLTPGGRKAAEAVVRRHMLAEWMLSQYLNVPLSKLHEEAHRLEHAISGDMEKELLSRLDGPLQCPHGNPLPGHEKSVAGWKPLVSFPPASHVTIRRLHEHAEDSHEVLTFLESKNIVPGTRAKVIEVSPVNETVELELGKSRVSLGFAVAKLVFADFED